MMTFDQGGKPPRSPIRAPGMTGAFHRIKTLKCFPEVRKKLIEGWPLGKVAEYIQIDMKESVDITHDSLISILHKFRKTIPAAELAQKALPKAVTDAIKETEESLDELRALEALFKLQLERVNIDHTLEKNIKKLMPGLTQDIRVAQEILVAIAKLKSDKGLTPKHLGTVNHQVEGSVVHAEIPSSISAKILENPQSRMKILGVMQRLLTSAPKIEIPISEETQQPTLAQDIDVEAVLDEPDPEQGKD